MVYNRRKAFMLFVSNLGIGGSQNHLSNCLKCDSVVPLI